MPQLEIPITVNVVGMPNVIAEMRRIVSDAVRQVAATEKDGAVVTRLNEVAALICQDLAAAEAKLAVERAPIHREPKLKAPVLGNMDVIGGKR